MKFVKKSEYFKNYREAYRAVILMWQDPDLIGHWLGKVIATVVLGTAMLVCCIVGIRPKGDDYE